MRNEEKLLVNACKSYFDGSSLQLPENIEWSRFFEIAKGHNLVAVCHCIFCKNKELPIPQNVRKLFEEKFFDLVFIFEKQSRYRDELRECFSEAGVPYIVFKGIALRELYPVPESRSMGDTDILIEPHNREFSRRILKDLGYELKASGNTVDEYEKNSNCIEVHTRLTDDFGISAFADAFDTAEFSGIEGRLNSSCHFAYLIAHTAAHLKYNGAGIRHILDLAILQREKDIDIENVLAILSGIGLRRFGEVLLSVCFEWFGCGIQFNENTASLCEYLVSYGVFGSMKESSEITISRLIQLGALDSAKTNKSPAALKLRLAFPPYRALKKAPYMQFLDKRPWLLPAAWCYRFFRNLKNNRRHMLEAVRNIDNKEALALAEEELEFFKEIGL